MKAQSSGGGGTDSSSPVGSLLHVGSISHIEEQMRRQHTEKS